MTSEYDWQSEDGTMALYCGDCIDRMRGMDAGSVQTCVTSPPYFGLRDYGVEGQIGLENTPVAYVARLVDVFQEVRRVLRDDGTLWLNLADSYANDGKWGGHTGGKHATVLHASPIGRNKKYTGLKPKDLIGIPWRVAFALQADGWWLRQDIIWHKPNPMPESVTDRCTKAHEYIFLLSKSARYYFDAGAIAEPCAESSITRPSQNVEAQQGGFRVPDKTNGPMKAVGGRRGRGGANSFRGQGHARTDANGPANRKGRDMTDIGTGETRNKRSVWTVATRPYKGAHFATFPPKLIEPCILAGCPAGGTVLDPFSGSATTGQVAYQRGRRYVGIDLNPDYIELSKARLVPLIESQQGSLFQTTPRRWK